MMEGWFAGIGLIAVAALVLLVVIGFGLIIHAILTEAP